MLFKLVLSCCILGIWDSILAVEYPVLTTPSGKIRGSTLFTSRLGRTIYAFRNIKYAKPPVGELRFKPPVPADRWKGIYNATEDGPLCPQLANFGTISEDCLMLNVYSTKLAKGTSNPKRPVLVYLHPGGFYAVGSPSYWGGPQYWMDQDIVLVTLNWRLATLGFLSTGDKLAPGNNGLKDQVLALKWIKTHIASFGGDPNSVTAQGYSAGAWSVVLHMLSPMSKGLITKGIVMGGSPLGSFPLPTEQLEIAKKQARIVGCPDDTSENIVKCLKTVPAEKLGQSLPQFAEYGDDPVLVWSPVVDGEFLTDNPIRLVLQGKFEKIPLIIGQTTLEFGYKALTVINNQSLIDEMNEDFERVAPIALIYERDTAQSRKVSRAVKRFYLKDKPVDKCQLDNLVKMYADGIVGFGAHRAATLMAEYNTQPVYRYCFTFQGRYSTFYPPGTNQTWGVVHHDELIYMLYDGTSFPNPEPEMIEKLTTLFTNFASTGKPIPAPNSKLDNIEWIPFTQSTQKYMDIGKKLVMKERLYKERFAFWDKLYPLSLYQ